MSRSLRDALLQSGLKPTETSRPKSKKKPRKKKHRSGSSEAAGTDGEVDLARAYAMRAREDARERAQAQREAQRKAQEKKERRRRLRELLDGKNLIREDADQLRHYEFHGKIRRVHVTGEQLRALNGGDLAVVQSGGRFMLVDGDIARKAAQIEPGCLALLVHPNADPSSSDEGIPDDLVW